MANIDPDQPVVTLITVHECAAKDQQALVDLLTEAVETIYQHAPGFVSASIHASVDGTRVTNYAQYESKEAFEALRGMPQIAPFIEKVGKLITKADPHLYRVTRSVTPAPKM